MSNEVGTDDFLNQILKLRNELNEGIAFLISHLTSLQDKLLQELQAIENVYTEETRTQRENLENLLRVRENMLRMQSSSRQQTSLIDTQIQMCEESIHSKRIWLEWSSDWDSLLSPICKVNVTERCKSSELDYVDFSPKESVLKSHSDLDLTGFALNIDSENIVKPPITHSRMHHQDILCTPPQEFADNIPPASASNPLHGSYAADTHPQLAHSSPNEQLDAFDNNFSNMQLADDPMYLIDKYAAVTVPIHSACTSGAGKEQLRNPRGVAIDRRENRIYIADRTNERIQVFSDTGKFVFGFTHTLMKGPKGICIEDRDGLVFVTLCDHNSIHSYSLGGVLVRRVGVIGCGPAQFNQPCGIATDTDSRVYVCDFGNDRVQVFTKQFRYLTVLTNKVTRPTDVKVLGDRVYVLDHRKYCISIFNRGGAFFREIIACGPESNQVKHPYFFDIDSMGNILISDLWNNCIKVFSPKGNFLCNIGSGGEEPGQFLQPTGIALVEECIVTVCEREQNQLQIFQI